MWLVDQWAKFGHQKGSYRLFGLVLTGGGARAAFQVGVLKAISEWSGEGASPFKVISGTSAGSINAAYIAAHADDFVECVRQLEKMWGDLQSSDVYKSPLLALSQLRKVGLFNRLTQLIPMRPNIKSLLNSSPLAHLLQERVPYERLDQMIEQGHLHSFTTSCINYNTGVSTTFFQAHESQQEWMRVRRVGQRANLSADHILASASIPFIFSPVKIGDHFFGDGSLRNYAPLSPPIKCGAKKLLVISVRQSDQGGGIQGDLSIGQIFSSVLNSILLDAVDVDAERLSRVNHTLSLLDNPHPKLSPIDVVMVRPSIDLGELTSQFQSSLPKTLRHLLEALGQSYSATDLISYLFFESEYMNALIEQGYNDAWAKKAEILGVLES